MTRSERDEAIREAVSALAARIRRRDHVEPATARVGPDQLAGEFIAALTTRGWRPTPARPPVDWRVTEPPADPDTVHTRVAELREQIRRAET